MRRSKHHHSGIVNGVYILSCGLSGRSPHSWGESLFMIILLRFCKGELRHLS